MLIAIIVAILAINVLVLVHEFGHFIVAKRRGIVVEIFSIGFGPKLFGFMWRGTEYRLCLVLFGGYVKFKGDELEESAKNEKGSFYSATPWSRILVCVAGGVFNIFFALILYLVIFIQGKPVTVDSQNTIIGSVKKDSIAEKIGILPGDRIVSINGEHVCTWEKLVYAIAFSKSDDVKIELERNSGLIVKDAKITVDKEVGIKMLGVYCKETIVVGKVIKDSPAEKSGMMDGDVITSVNGQKVFHSQALIDAIRENEGKEITLLVDRQGTEVAIKTIPQKSEGREFAEIGFALATNWIKIYPKPLEQFSDDLVRTWRTLSGLVTRHIPVRAISGPVGIVGIIGISMQVGWIPLLCIVALISLNLGIVNLLPVPVLDGGHIMFNLLEMIRRRPLGINTILKIQNVFTALLIMFAVYVTYNDILRMFHIH